MSPRKALRWWSLSLGKHCGGGALAFSPRKAVRRAFRKAVRRDLAFCPSALVSLLPDSPSPPRSQSFNQLTCSRARARTHTHTHKHTQPHAGIDDFQQTNQGEVTYTRKRAHASTPWLQAPQHPCYDRSRRHSDAAGEQRHTPVCGCAADLVGGPGRAGGSILLSSYV